jgi:hypothetical protein
MRKIIVGLLLIVSFVLVGCGSSVSLVSIPKKGATRVSNIGDSMYTYYYGRFNKRARLSDNRENIKYGIDARGVRFDPLDGHECTLHMRDKSLFDYNCDGVLTHNREGIKLSRPLNYEIFPHPDSNAAHILSHVLLYQGRVGNKIKISYREFSNNLARSAFTQDIEYQLDGMGRGNIGIKGIKIRVIRATNMDIKYKILQEYH